MERLICVLIGYAFGLFQTGYLVGKMYHTDIRKHGSGNAGTTNALRTFGKKAGALTLLGDMLKCIAAVLITAAIFRNRCPEMLTLLKIYAAAGCVLGHNFPFYLGFKGGKGIAASAGMLIAVDVRVFWICFVIFFALFFTLHYVSVCSMSSYVTALICFIIFGQMGHYGMTQAPLTGMYVVVALMAVMAIWRHRENIRRLAAGTENKVFLSSKKKRE